MTYETKWIDHLAMSDKYTVIKNVSNATETSKDILQALSEGFEIYHTETYIVGNNAMTTYILRRSIQE